MGTNFNSSLVKHIIFQKNGVSSKAGKMAYGKKSNTIKDFFAEVLDYNQTTDQIADLFECFEAIAIFRMYVSNNKYYAERLITLKRSDLIADRSITYSIIAGSVYYGDRLRVVAVVRSNYVMSKSPSWINLVLPENFDANYANVDVVEMNSVLYTNAYIVNATNTTLPSNLHNSASFNFNNLFPVTQFTYTGPDIFLMLTMDSSIQKITVTTDRYQYSFLSTSSSRTLHRVTDYKYSDIGDDTFAIVDEFEPGDIVQISVTVVSSLGSSWYMEETGFTWIVGGNFTGNTTGKVYLKNAWQANAAFSALSYSNLQDRSIKFVLSPNNNAELFASSVLLIGGVSVDVYNTSTHETSTKSTLIGYSGGTWTNNSIALSANELAASGGHGIMALWDASPSIVGKTVNLAIQYGNQVQTTIALTIQQSSGSLPTMTNFNSQELGYINYPTDNTSSGSGGSWHDIANPGGLETPWEPGGGGIIITPPYIPPGGTGTHGGCVERNTPIMVSADGDTLPACDLRTGGMIVGWKDGKIVPTKIIQKYVARKINQFVRIYLSNKTFLEITPNHPVLCDDGIYRAYNSKDYEKLTVDHRIQTIDGIVDIESLDLIELEPETVINFLTETDNFIATEVVVGAESPDVKGVLVKDQFGHMVDVHKMESPGGGGINW